MNSNENYFAETNPVLETIEVADVENIASMNWAEENSNR